MLPNGDILRRVADEIIPAMAAGRRVPRLLDRRCGQRPRRGGTGERGRAARARRAGLGRHRRRQGRHADIHGRRRRERVRRRRSRFSTSWAQKAVHCGASGNGQAAKICNNMILGVTMIATCEAFALADRLGLDRQAMYDVVSTSSGQSWSMNDLLPGARRRAEAPADNDYRPGFAAELMLKDLRLSQQAAEAAGADTPMGATGRRALPQLCRGRGRRGPRLLGHAAALLAHSGGRAPLPPARSHQTAPTQVTLAPRLIPAIQTL